MRKLPEVEEAKAIMTVAVNWSVMKWLTEKKRVRKAADVANAALDAANAELKARWSSELKAAYAELANGGAAKSGDAELRALAKRAREADEAAHAARMDAEDTFDKAERILSTSMAREGAGKAIKSWELHEKALEICETGVGK